MLDVEHLRREVLDRTVPVSTLLRRAKEIASRLGDADALLWIDRELSGYREGEEIPGYRKVVGEPKAMSAYYGWQPIQFPDADLASTVSARPVGDSIAHLEDILLRDPDGVGFVSYNAPQKAKLMEMLAGAPIDIHLHVDRAQFARIVDAVRNRIHDWMLKLRAEGLEVEERQGPSAVQPLTAVEAAILAKLNGVVPSAALSYEQALRDLQHAGRKSWRGTGVELREALREVLDALAPDADVTAVPGYEPEPDEHGRPRPKPTMRQKARFILKNGGLGKTALKAPQDAAGLVEELTASLARSAYERGSVATHVATTRQDVLRVKGYVDSVLCDVLDVHG